MRFYIKFIRFYVTLMFCHFRLLFEINLILVPTNLDKSTKEMHTTIASSILNYKTLLNHQFFISGFFKKIFNFHGMEVSSNFLPIVIIRIFM